MDELRLSVPDPENGWPHMPLTPLNGRGYFRVADDAPGVGRDPGRRGRQDKHRNTGYALEYESGWISLYSRLHDQDLASVTLVAGTVAGESIECAATNSILRAPVILITVVKDDTPVTESTAIAITGSCRL